MTPVEAPVLHLLSPTVMFGVLVPAAMRLVGNAGWWAPAPLRRLHERIGLREDTTRFQPAGIRGA